MHQCAEMLSLNTFEQEVLNVTRLQHSLPGCDLNSLSVAVSDASLVLSGVKIL